MKLSTPKLPALAGISVLILVIILCFLNTPDAANVPQPDQSGWQHSESGTYYISDDGTPATGWQEIDGNTYYFRASGTMVTGWLLLDESYYYFLESGTAASGPVIIDDTLHFFLDRGIPATGWIAHEGHSLYLDSTGKAVTGWQTIDGACYYFDAQGLPCPGWQELEGKTYYIHRDGRAAQGRNVIDGTVHYFASNGQEILLVNPWHYVPEDYTVELTNINEDYQVAAESYDDLILMLADCEANGGKPVVCSAYRTQEYQQKLFDKKIKKLMATGMSREKAREQAGTVVAVPGTSEHQLGLALDIIHSGNWSLNKSQEDTATQQWLMANSWRYGWILRYPNGKSDITGIIYEPWHYRYVGRETAAEIYGLGLCLEEYLNMLNASVG